MALTSPAHHRVPPPVSLAVANISRAKAQEVRAEWLIGISADILTMADLLAFAATPPGRPLRRISLFQLLTSRPGRGPATAKAVLAKLRVALRCETPSQAMTIGWLLDNRAGGRRFIAWGSCVEVGRELTPWNNWPFVAAPSGPVSIFR